MKTKRMRDRLIKNREGNTIEKYEMIQCTCNPSCIGKFKTYCKIHGVKKVNNQKAEKTDKIWNKYFKLVNKLK